MNTNESERNRWNLPGQAAVSSTVASAKVEASAEQEIGAVFVIRVNSREFAGTLLSVNVL